jgi:enoyl-CoA hydratase
MDDVRYEVDGAVAVVTLNAPDRSNAMTPEMVGVLMDFYAQAGADPSIGALLVRAEGKAFCAGADLPTLRQAAPDPLATEAFVGIGSIYEMFRRLVKVPIPTIAAVQGPCIGAGVNFPLACDVRIVSEGARFVGFGRAGVHPGGGHLELLRAVDRQAAAWLALCNQSIDAAEAVRLGLAMRMTAPDALDAEALAIAHAAAADPELARMVTASFRTIDGMAQRHDAAVHIERGPQVWSLRRIADKW